MLRLVCAQPGVDTNMDSWVGRSPPLLIAISGMDHEMAEILLEAETPARTSFDDVWTNWLQEWYTIRTPVPNQKPCALHYACLGGPQDATQVRETVFSLNKRAQLTNRPARFCQGRNALRMAQLLCRHGADVWSRCDGPLPQVGACPPQMEGRLQPLATWGTPLETALGVAALVSKSPRSTDEDVRPLN